MSNKLHGYYKNWFWDKENEIIDLPLVKPLEELNIDDLYLINNNENSFKQQKQVKNQIIDNTTESKKYTKEIKQFVENQSFDEEILNDQVTTLEYLEKSNNTDDALVIAGVDIYKRALTLIGSGDMVVLDESGNIKQATDNVMPVSSYLNHGARIVIEIPKGEQNNSLFNWLTSGDKDICGVSNHKTQELAMAEDKYVYNRYAATHGVKIKEDGTVSETKGFLIGLKDGVTSYSSELIASFLNIFPNYTDFGFKSFFDSSAITNHYGIDLLLGVDSNGKDKSGAEVSKVDGDHGHLYFYYQKPTNDTAGVILLGVEGASPNSSHHSKTGASDPYSPTYGSLWEDLAKKNANNSNCVIGSKYNGRKISLTQSELDKIVEINVQEIDNKKIATVLPSNCLESFLAEITNKSLVVVEECISVNKVTDSSLTHSSCSFGPFGIEENSGETMELSGSAPEIDSDY